MSLNQVIGQERALKILRGCIAKNRVAHAYLFAGEDGIGKKLTAVNFAKALNCSNDANDSLFAAGEKEKSAVDADSCDTCSSCIKIDKGSHPDVFFIAPENGLIKVNAIRKLEESLSYKSFEGNWKIVVIDGAETLNQSAANAFLKTLEEPPGQSVLVLISSMPELIPSTIRSRCQRINFSPLPLKKMGGMLEHELSAEGTPTKNSRAELLGLLSGGRPGWALSGDLIGTRDRSFDEFKSLLSSVNEDLWEDREAMQEWFEWVQLWLRDIAVFAATGRVDLMINKDREKEIKNISQRVKLKDVLKLSNTFYNIKDTLRFNLNKQLTLYHTYLLLKQTFAQ